ncbi:hypothetical protein TNCV_784591 [Trichonephila clavipes]|nr:hypothetical protein TNCV_784591 [Trichonephila clavipes]
MFVTWHNSNSRWAQREYHPILSHQFAPLPLRRALLHTTLRHRFRKVNVPSEKKVGNTCARQSDAFISRLFSTTRGIRSQLPSGADGCVPMGLLFSHRMSHLALCSSKIFPCCTLNCLTVFDIIPWSLNSSNLISVDYLWDLIGRDMNR